MASEHRKCAVRAISIRGGKEWRQIHRCSATHCGYGRAVLVLLRDEVVVDGLLPFLAGGLSPSAHCVAHAHCPRRERGARVDDVDLCCVGAGRFEAHIDHGDQEVRQKVDVLKMTGVEIEEPC